MRQKQIRAKPVCSDVEPAARTRSGAGAIRRTGLAFGVLALGVVLSGCSGLAPGFGFKKKGQSASVARTVPVSRDVVALIPAQGPPRATHAVLSLPSAAGNIKDVKERHYANGTRQEILLEGYPGTPGQNVIDVSVRTNSSRRTGSDLYVGKPDERGIRNEIVGRFPDVRMNIVTQPLTNRFGVFGLAIGRHRNGARCVFAWQWIKDLRSSTPGVSNLTRLGAAIGGRRLTASVRIRLCQKGVTVDQLAGHVQGLNVMGRAPIRRLINMDRRRVADSPSGVVSQRGVNSSPILSPVGGTLESTLTGSSSRTALSPVRSARKSVRRKRRVRRTAAKRPQRDYNRIRHSDARSRSGGPPAIAPGSRYLAPVTNAPAAAPGASASASSTYRPAGSVALPPEAYRGPGR